MDKMVKEEKQAPYAPPGTVLMIIRYYRRQDVPATLTKEKLTQLGVTEGLLNRTWQALVYLGLIDKDGKTTEDLKAIRYATDDEYPKVLGGVLRKAYADIFSVIGPTETANDVRLLNAFTPYSPGGQRPRMVVLFTGLCQEAQIPLAVTRVQRSTQAESGSRPARPKAATTPRTSRTSTSPRRETPRGAGTEDPLFAWFNTHPAIGEAWPMSARERWNKTLMAIIDGLYEIEDPWTTTDEEESEGGGENPTVNEPSLRGQA